MFGTCLICNDMFQTLLPYAFFDLATQSSAQLYLNILHPGPSQQILLFVRLFAN